MLLIRNAEVEGSRDLDVFCHDGKIHDIGQNLVHPDAETVDANGGVLLPGLHDHHVHLFAHAAARRSVSCGPPEVGDDETLATVLRNAEDSTDGWIRGVGYHESVAGMLDRHTLDAMVSERPIRIQHRSGKMWFMNSVALQVLSLNESNGQLFRKDEWIRERLGSAIDHWADVTATSRLLASYGVTGITDATVSNNAEVERDWSAIDLYQRVRLMGNEDLGHGSLKIMLDDYALPEIDGFQQRIRAAHDRGRPVAVHCVTRTELVYTLSALTEIGSLAGDRIEHASVVDESTLDLMLRVGVCVVTQPNFLVERGDQYLKDVDAQQLEFLYRAKTFLDAGIPLGGGTDAPFGGADPWAAMRAAVHRRTASGEVIGEQEKLTPEQAIAMFTSSVDMPGGASRRIAPGQTADLCLLQRPWAEARDRTSKDDVAMTVMAGTITYRR